MDGCSSWLPFLGGGIGNGGVSSRSGLEVQQQQDSPISSQVEEQLQQFYWLMDMEKNGRQSEPEVVPSSESSKFPFLSESPDETLSLKPQSSNNSNSRHHQAEVSSQQIQLSSSVTYGGDCHYDLQCFGNLDTILNLDEFKCQEAHNNGGHAGGAFMPYVRHRSPKKKPNKPGSGGQRAIKAAMSAVAKMHMVRLAQWRQCYQYQMERAVAAPTGSNNQQQHVLSERKRREKLNDSFKALRTVLPPETKKDKASILTTARDYVSTLESRVSELEEKNRMLLVELQHGRNNGGNRDDEKFEVDIDINREACAAKGTSQEF